MTPDLPDVGPQLRRLANLLGIVSEFDAAALDHFRSADAFEERHDHAASTRHLIAACVAVNVSSTAELCIEATGDGDAAPSLAYVLNVSTLDRLTAAYLAAAVDLPTPPTNAPEATL